MSSAVMGLYNFLSAHPVSASWDIVSGKIPKAREVVEYARMAVVDGLFESGDANIAARLVRVVDGSGELAPLPSNSQSFFFWSAPLGAMEPQIAEYVEEAKGAILEEADQCRQKLQTEGLFVSGSLEYLMARHRLPSGVRNAILNSGTREEQKVCASALLRGALGFTPMHCLLDHPEWTRGAIYVFMSPHDTLALEALFVEITERTDAPTAKIYDSRSLIGEQSDLIRMTENFQLDMKNPGFDGYASIVKACASRPAINLLISAGNYSTGGEVAQGIDIHAALLAVATGREVIPVYIKFSDFIVNGLGLPVRSTTPFAHCGDPIGTKQGVVSVQARMENFFAANRPTELS